METTLKVSTFMESSHMLPLLQAAQQMPSLSVFPQKQQLSFLSREDLHRFISITAELTSTPPGSTLQRHYPNTAKLSRSLSLSQEKLDLHRKGSAGVRNMRSAWLFVF